MKKLLQIIFAALGIATGLVQVACAMEEQENKDIGFFSNNKTNLEIKQLDPKGETQNAKVKPVVIKYSELDQECDLIKKQEKWEKDSTMQKNDPKSPFKKKQEEEQDKQKKENKNNAKKLKEINASNEDGIKKVDEIMELGLQQLEKVNQKKEEKKKNYYIHLIASKLGGKPFTLKNIKDVIKRELFENSFNGNRRATLVLALLFLGLAIAIVLTFGAQLWVHCSVFSQIHSKLTSWKLLSWLGYTPAGVPVVDAAQLGFLPRLIRGFVDFFLGLEDGLKKSAFNIFDDHATYGDFIGWMEVIGASLCFIVSGYFFYTRVVTLNPNDPCNTFEKNWSVEFKEPVKNEIKEEK